MNLQSYGADSLFLSLPDIQFGFQLLSQPIKLSSLWLLVAGFKFVVLAILFDVDRGEHFVKQLSNRGLGVVDVSFLFCLCLLLNFCLIHFHLGGVLEQGRPVCHQLYIISIQFNFNNINAIPCEDSAPIAASLRTFPKPPSHGTAARPRRPCPKTTPP